MMMMTITANARRTGFEWFTVGIVMLFFFCNVNIETNIMISLINQTFANKVSYQLIVFKCLRKLSPSYLSSQFKFVHNNHSHLTRSHTGI